MTYLEDPTPEWSIPLDDGSTGVEDEDTSSGVMITAPFDPTRIRVTPRTMSLDLLLRRMVDDRGLDLSPGFQRKAGIWTSQAQSKLIESILIRIPIPAFYIDMTDEDHWLVVDGLQRLTTLRRFVITQELKLSGLEFLTELDGSTYAELSPRFKRRILETQAILYAIEEGTPPNVKFNIFKRINTGGLPLSAQEIRHALNQGPATELLKRLAESDEFLVATARGISDKRMAAQECVLRFMAFTQTPFTNYKMNDLDGFLNDAMADINSASKAELESLESRFKKAMIFAQRIFGYDAFRKRYDKDHGRYPINKALFEAWSVNLGELSDTQLEALMGRREMLVDAFIDLMKTPGFSDAVSQGTGDSSKVKLRFGEVGRIIQEVLA